MLNARRQPCAECPWRRDAPTNHFPSEAFRRMAASAYDMSRTIFQCHETSDNVPLVCAGFLERGADHNLTIRLAYGSGEIAMKDRSGGLDLYKDFREMAQANGIEGDDEALTACRSAR